MGIVCGFVVVAGPGAMKVLGVGNHVGCAGYVAHEGDEEDGLGEHDG